MSVDEILRTGFQLSWFIILMNLPFHFFNSHKVNLPFHLSEMATIKLGSQFFVFNFTEEAGEWLSAVSVLQGRIRHIEEGSFPDVMQSAKALLYDLYAFYTGGSRLHDKFPVQFTRAVREIEGRIKKYNGDSFILGQADSLAEAAGKAARAHETAKLKAGEVTVRFDDGSFSPAVLEASLNHLVGGQYDIPYTPVVSRVAKLLADKEGLEAKVKELEKKLSDLCFEGAVTDSVASDGWETLDCFEYCCRKCIVREDLNTNDGAKESDAVSQRAKKRVRAKSPDVLDSDEFKLAMAERRFEASRGVRDV